MTYSVSFNRPGGVQPLFRVPCLFCEGSYECLRQRLTP